MKIKPTIAAVAVISLSVLLIGQPALAAGPDSSVIPPSFMPGNQVPMPQPQQPPQMPQVPQLQVPMFEPQGTAQAPAISQQSLPASKPNTSNTYVKGTCTWYAKEKRPDLPNGLGNGGQWVKNAAKRGFKTGTAPQAGAIGEQPGHVVYIESTSSNTVSISEMNYAGKKGVVHKRTVKASTFRYIY